MAEKKPAPKFLNLIKIKLPPGGIVSIGHRISGVLMFLSIPFIAWEFDRSLESEQGFRGVQECLQSTPVILLSVILAWALSHHLLAGVRHLFLDVDLGVDKNCATISAWLVNIGALLMAAVYAASLL
ncbi:MAG TPA: succinate dehydrogenase, cytochrome b556 subunit [Gammaproteobacteria bacterium]|nr:succinate dehydrogenase, cytochrome b556 subunit [Gammaproteobacteria bacterium]